MPVPSQISNVLEQEKPQGASIFDALIKFLASIQSAKSAVTNWGENIYKDAPEIQDMQIPSVMDMYSGGLPLAAGFFNVKSPTALEALLRVKEKMPARIWEYLSKHPTEIKVDVSKQVPSEFIFETPDWRGIYANKTRPNFQELKKIYNKPMTYQDLQSIPKPAYRANVTSGVAHVIPQATNTATDEALFHELIHAAKRLRTPFGSPVPGVHLTEQGMKRLEGKTGAYMHEEDFPEALTAALYPAKKPSAEVVDPNKLLDYIEKTWPREMIKSR